MKHHIFPNLSIDAIETAERKYLVVITLNRVARAYFIDAANELEAIQEAMWAQIFAILEEACAEAEGGSIPFASTRNCQSKRRN